MAGMVRLIYSSGLTGAGRDCGASLLPGILDAASRNNTRLGVSGMLLALGDGFLQVLEGSAPAVDAVFQRVREDRRHQYVKVLDRSPAERREFGAWAMCGADLTATDNAILSVLALKPGLNLQALHAGDAMRLLRAVKAIQTAPSKAA